MAEGKRYHINPETGRPNICNATEKRGCKYKTEDGKEPPHFPSKEAAQAHQNEKDEKKYGALATMKKNTASDATSKGLQPSSDEIHQAAALIEEESDDPEYNAAKEKLRDSLTEFYHQSKDYNNLGKNHPGREDDEEELRHITQVIRDDMAHLEQIKAGGGISDEEHRQNLEYLRSQLREEADLTSVYEAQSEDTGIVEVSVMKDFHAQGEAEILSLQDQALSLEEKVVDMENNGAPSSAEYEQTLDKLNQVRYDLMKSRDRHLGSLKQREDMRQINLRIEEQQGYVEQAREELQSAESEFNQRTDQMQALEMDRLNLVSKGDLNPGEKHHLETVERDLATAQREYPDAGKRLNRARADYATSRSILEEEKLRKQELQGEIYSQATGQVAYSDPTEQEIAVEDAEREVNRHGRKMDDLEYDRDRAEAAQDKNAYAFARMQLMQVENDFNEAVKRQLAAQDAMELARKKPHSS